MSAEPRRFVEPEVSDARVERLWGAVAERLEARRKRGVLWAGGVALALAGAAGLWLAVGTEQGAAPRSARAMSADAKLQTAAQPLAVRLSDGSSLELQADSEVEVRGSKSSRVTLQLARGAVRCDVSHHPERSFSVVAGDVEVRVVGTAFTVTRGDGALPRVEVAVQRGVVDVESRRRPGVVARVAAGQSWIQSREGDAAASPASAHPFSSALSAPSAAPNASASASRAEPRATAPSARELFERAGEHRRAGDAAAAARAYEELLQKHPADARASLALFELGRLRMDRLGDRAGAVAALERALASNLGPSFREDALARLVSAYAAQGNFAACARSRDRYLAAYPAGVHAGAVAARCGAR